MWKMIFREQSKNQHNFLVAKERMEKRNLGRDDVRFSEVDRSGRKLKERKEPKRRNVYTSNVMKK